MKLYKIQNPTTKSKAVRAYGGLEGIDPKRTRVCQLSDDAAEAAKDAGLKLSAAGKDAKPGYIDEAPKADIKPKAKEKTEGEG